MRQVIRKHIWFDEGDYQKYIKPQLTDKKIKAKDIYTWCKISRQAFYDMVNGKIACNPMVILYLCKHEILLPFDEKQGWIMAI